ncbi:MAG: methionyl-tRNA formyltransferase [Actinomycetia bacterium]|nr:methionyl-tRNA formyltransferase [Actinomycetes bacterium]
MRYAFFGTPRFAADILERLRAAGLPPSLVVTRADAVSRRGSRLRPSAVAARALDAGLPLARPAELTELAEDLDALDLDCVVVAAFGRIMPRSLLEISRSGWINVHASLLPRWRGAAPIQRAILEGDEMTGVSIMRMEAGLDTGPVCAQESVTIGEASLRELEDTLAARGAELLIDLMPRLALGTLRWQEQDETQASYARKLQKGELDLDPSLDPATCVRRVRASSDASPARCRLQVAGKELVLRVLEAELRSGECAQPGTARDAGDHLALCAASKSCYCAVTRLQRAGGKAQPAAEFLRGLQQRESLAWR